MKRLRQSLVYFLIIIVSVMGLHFALIRAGESSAIAIWENSEKGMNLDRRNLSARCLNFLRGDYRTSVAISPFQPLHWTVNVVTGEVISWQSQKKEDSLWRNLLF